MAKVRMTKEQRAWCKRYEQETTFEPLMDDFLAGNEPFVKAARDSLRWFEDWSSDAFIRAGEDIPGADEYDEREGELRATATKKPADRGAVQK